LTSGCAFKTPKIKSAVPNDPLPTVSGQQDMDSFGAAAISPITGMTKRQRAKAEDETAYSIQPEPERITKARQRIEELHLLIHHWEKHEREKQVRQENSMS